jgi:hypothetical protein
VIVVDIGPNLHGVAGGLLLILAFYVWRKGK